MNFIKYLKNLSVKQTVILTGIGITLFLHLLEGVKLSMATGKSAYLLVSLTLWGSVAMATAIILTILVFAWYVIKSGIKKIKNHRNRKVKERTSDKKVYKFKSK